MERIELKRMGQERVVSLPVVGRYGEFGDHLERLRAWLRERGAEPVGPPLGVFHSSLSEAPPARCRYEVQIPVAAELEASEGVEVKTVPMGDYATLVYSGPESPGAVSDAYERLLDWAAERGLESSGPAREVYLSAPSDRRNGVGAAELQVPVHPAGYKTLAG